MKLVQLLVASIVACSICSSGCKTVREEPLPKANGGYLHAAGLKLILKHKRITGKWPLDSRELTKSSVLPAVVQLDPTSHEVLQLSERNFDLKSAVEQDGMVKIIFEINGEQYVDENSVEALSYLK